MQARKQKTFKKTIEKKTAWAHLVDVEGTDETEKRDQGRHLDLHTGIDLEAENWAISLEKKAFCHENDKTKDYTEDY